MYRLNPYIIKKSTIGSVTVGLNRVQLSTEANLPRQADVVVVGELTNLNFLLFILHHIPLI